MKNVGVRARRTNSSRSDCFRAQQSPLRPAFGRCDLANSGEVGVFLEGKAPYLLLYSFSHSLLQSADITVHEFHWLEHVTALPRSIGYPLRELDLVLRSSLRGAHYSVVRALQNVVREEPTDHRIVHVWPSRLECVATVEGAGVNLRLIHILGFFREKVSQGRTATASEVP